MRETKYYCDKCKKEIGIQGTQDEKSVDVNIKVSFPEKQYDSYTKRVDTTITLCNECGEKIGIKRVQKIIKDTDNKQSDYDKLREKAMELLDLLGLNISF